MKKAIGSLAVIAVIAAIACISIYNNLVNLDEGVNTAWAQVETVLQRRYDLIPNLVNTVKGYAQHEKGVLEEVTRLRSQWGEAKGTEAKAKAANELESALGRLMVVVEKYPDLKANQNFLSLQDELAGTENRISVERRRYNDAVRAYNVAIRRFPANMAAGALGFAKRAVYFEADKEAKTAPKVQF